MIACLLVTGGLAAANLTVTNRVPYHGPLLKLSGVEWMLLAWVPVSAFLCAHSGTPARWWIYYGLASVLVAWPGVASAVLYVLSGRRSWMMSRIWPAKLVGVHVYAMTGALLGGAIGTLIRRRIAATDDTSPVARARRSDSCPDQVRPRTPSPESR